MNHDISLPRRRRILDPRHLERAIIAEATSPGDLILPVDASREAARRSGYPSDLALPGDLLAAVAPRHRRVVRRPRVTTVLLVVLGSLYVAAVGSLASIPTVEQPAPHLGGAVR